MNGWLDQWMDNGIHDQMEDLMDGWIYFLISLKVCDFTKKI